MCILNEYPTNSKYLDRHTAANSVDHQTASKGAFCLGSTLFAIP